MALARQLIMYPVAGALLKCLTTPRFAGVRPCLSFEGRCVRPEVLNWFGAAGHSRPNWSGLTWGAAGPVKRTGGIPDQTTRNRGHDDRKVIVASSYWDRTAAVCATPETSGRTATEDQTGPHCRKPASQFSVIPSLNLKAGSVPEIRRHS